MALILISMQVLNLLYTRHGGRIHAVKTKNAGVIMPPLFYFKESTMTKPEIRKQNLVRVQVHNLERQGEDIIIPDERGVDWKMKDGAKIAIPESIYNAMNDAVLTHHVYDDKTKQTRPVKKMRFMARLIRDDEPLDDEGSAVSEILDDLTKDLDKKHEEQVNRANGARKIRLDSKAQK